MASHVCDDQCAHTITLWDTDTARIAEVLTTHSAGHCVWRHPEGPAQLATFLLPAMQEILLDKGWRPPPLPPAGEPG